MKYYRLYLTSGTGDKKLDELIFAKLWYDLFIKNFLDGKAPHCWFAERAYDKRTKKYYFPVAVSDDNAQLILEFLRQITDVITQQFSAELVEFPIPEKPDKVLDPNCYTHGLFPQLAIQISQQFPSTCGGVGIFNRDIYFCNLITSMLGNSCSLELYEEWMCSINGQFFGSDQSILSNGGSVSIVSPDEFYKFFYKFFERGLSKIADHIEKKEHVSQHSLEPNKLISVSVRCRLQLSGSDERTHLLRRLEGLQGSAAEQNKTRVFMPPGLASFSFDLDNKTTDLNQIGLRLTFDFDLKQMGSSADTEAKAEMLAKIVAGNLNLEVIFWYLRLEPFKILSISSYTFNAKELDSSTNTNIQRLDSSTDSFSIFRKVQKRPSKRNKEMKVGGLEPLFANSSDVPFTSGSNNTSVTTIPRRYSSIF